MELIEFQPMTREECQQTSGGIIPFLVGALVGCIAIPVIKNLWNATSGGVKLPGGIETKWDNSKDHSKEISNLKADLSKLEAKFTHLIPPFYEF